MTILASVDDVSAGLLAEGGPTSAMKLQKLLYYVQAWHLVHHNAPAFDAPLEAWVDGPVIRRIFQRHKGHLMVRSWPWGNVGRLPRSVRRVVQDVVVRYGSKAPEELSSMTHREQPWRAARKGVPPTVRSTKEIEPQTMRTFYGRLLVEPHTAVDDVIASARLEGGTTSAPERAELLGIIAGRLHADDVVRRIIAER